MSFGTSIGVTLADITIAIGITGAACVLLAFFMLQMNKWKKDNIVYDLFNLVGSALLVAYAVLLKSYPFLVLNGIWLMLSMKDIVEDIELKVSKKKKARNSRRVKLMHKTR